MTPRLPPASGLGHRARALLRRAFLEELPLKVISLVIAVILFAVVRGDRQAAAAIYVKVIYTLPADQVLVSDPTGEVRVGVRGSWLLLQRLEDHGVEPIRVDVHDVRDGMFRIEDHMVRLPSGLRVASITPSEVMLKFEPRVRKEVPVEPVLEGQPDDGFRVAKVLASPSRVRLEGPRSVLAGLTRVRTRPLKISGAREPLSGEVALEQEPHHCHYLDSSTVIAVKVDINAAIVERLLANVPVRVSGLTRLGGTADPPTANVILRGPAERIRGLPSDAVSLVVDAQLADLRPPARYQRPLAVSGLPAGVAAEVQPDSVSLVTHRK